MSQARQLLEDASLEAGLNDFGDSQILAALEPILTLPLPFKPAARAARHKMIVRWLVNRLRTVRDLKAHREIHAENVRDPIVILGLPRSGTSALQRMISAHPDVQTLFTWQVENPAFFPGERRGDRAGERIDFARSLSEAVREANPELFAAHATLPEDAEEDTFLHNMQLRSIHNFVLFPHSVEFFAYLRAQPRHDSYAFVADMYRYLQWQRGGRMGKRWIMKSPNHLGCMEEMLDCHPGAIFLLPERDPAIVFASTCKLFEVYYGEQLTRQDPRDLGRSMLEFWRFEMERHKDAVARLGDRARILRIPYEELVGNPIEAAAAACRFAGLAFDEADAAQIGRWIADNPQGKHGSFSYALDRYGVAPDEIREAFA